uniref:Uncharacterized protein n=1 Tax=Rhizophora mucronata TaxID=61149 RepID=A0A2P2QAK9_RHIMU
MLSIISVEKFSRRRNPTHGSSSGSGSGRSPSSPSFLEVFPGKDKLARRSEVRVLV